MRRIICALMVVVFANVACGKDQPEKTAADVLGGQEVIETILKADKVEAYRLKDQFFKEKLSEYEASAGPIKLDAKQAQSLSQTVAAYDSYERETPKGCEPVFGVRTTFSRGDQQVDVVYCFECQILAVYHQGKRVGGGQFDPAQRKLEALAKQMFPKDEAIQGLGKKRD